jgi:hypothetical protein
LNPGIPDPEGEYAVEATQHVRPVAGIHRKQNLGVGLGGEAKAVAFKLFSQLLEVVELAVVGDPIPAVGTGHRLRPPGSRVDDAQAPMSQCSRHRSVDAGKAPHALAVGAAVGHEPGHRDHGPLVGPSHASADPAHLNAANGAARRSLPRALPPKQSQEQRARRTTACRTRAWCHRPSRAHGRGPGVLHRPAADVSRRRSPGERTPRRAGRPTSRSPARPA